MKKTEESESEEVEGIAEGAAGSDAANQDRLEDFDSDSGLDRDLDFDLDLELLEDICTQPLSDEPSGMFEGKTKQIRERVADGGYVCLYLDDIAILEVYEQDYMLQDFIYARSHPVSNKTVEISSKDIAKKFVPLAACKEERETKIHVPDPKHKMKRRPKGLVYKKTKSGKRKKAESGDAEVFPEKDCKAPKMPKKRDDHQDGPSGGAGIAT